MARLQAQAAENGLLKERQAKSSSDLQVSTHPTYLYPSCSLDRKQVSRVTVVLA